MSMFNVCGPQTWYTSQIKMISDWLTERLDCSLHPYQLACLLNITRVMYLIAPAMLWISFSSLVGFV